MGEDKSNFRDELSLLAKISNDIESSILSKGDVKIIIELDSFEYNEIIKNFAAVYHSNDKFNIEISNEKTHDICYVGLISKIRGIEEMIRMLKFTKAKMTLIGEFQSKEEETFIKNLPTWKKVNFLGKKNSQEVAKILSQSKMGIVIFHPEPNHINAQPNKIFEYMAASLPIVTSDFPLWKSIVTKHNTGICVNPLAPKEIASAVNVLLKNKEQSIQMGKNGQKAVQEVFNWKQENEKLINLYQQILK